MGFRGIELNARDARPSDMSDTAIRQLRKWLEDRNLRVTSMRFPTRRGYDQSDDLDRRVDATKDAMRLATRLDCRYVVNAIGHVAAAGEPARDTLNQVIDDLGRFGTRVGAFLAAETGATSASELSEVIRGTETGYVAVALNPGGMVVHRQNVAEAIELLGDRVALLMATDGVIDIAAGRGLAVPMGRGSVDFAAVLGGLERHEFDGPITFGHPETIAGDRAVVPQIAAAAGYLTEVMTG